MAEFTLQTERLILRDWRADDLNAFAAINRDPELMATAWHDHRPERDFSHPGVAEDDPLRPHVLYQKEPPP